MNNLNPAIFVVGFSFLMSCSGNAKNVGCTESEKRDWYQVGYQTALDGKSIRSFDEYQSRCDGKIDKIAKNSYIDGYTKGIMEYCTYDKGYDLGINNFEDPKTCPFELRSAFNDGYKRGLYVYRERVKIMEKRSQDFEDDQYRQSIEQAEMGGAGGN